MSKEYFDYHKKEEIVQRSSVLKYFLSDNFDFNIDNWDSDAASKIIDMYHEIEKEQGTGWDIDIVKNFALAWRVSNHTNPDTPLPHISVAFGTLIMSGYEIGNTADARMVHDDVFKKITKLGFLKDLDQVNYEFEYEKNAIAHLMGMGIQLKNIKSEQSSAPLEPMASKDSEFGVFRKFINEELNLDGI